MKSRKRKSAPKIGTRFWKVRAIIGESKRHYLIDWEDDSDTGQTYKPTWEFKNCANEEAVAHWKVTKREKAEHSSHATQEKPVRSTTPTPKRKRPPSKQVTLRQPAGSERRDLTNASSTILGDSTRQESEDPEEKMWKVKDILKETRSDYLIAWESDPDTGKQYEPTWEPKKFANAETVAHWEEKKKKKAEEIWTRQLQVPRGVTTRNRTQHTAEVPAKTTAATSVETFPQHSQLRPRRKNVKSSLAAHDVESSDSDSPEPPAKRRATLRSRKRAAKTPPAAQVEELVEEWKVKSIISEDKEYYLIEWESDPETGKSFMPTWEPKSLANKETVAHWERKKRIMSNSKAAKSVKSVTAARSSRAETHSAQLSPLRTAPFLFQRPSHADTRLAHVLTPRRAPTLFARSTISPRPMVEPDFDTEYDTFSSSEEDRAYDTAASTQKYSKFEDTPPARTPTLEYFQTRKKSRKRAINRSCSLSSVDQSPTPPFVDTVGSTGQVVSTGVSPAPRSPTPLFFEAPHIASMTSKLHHSSTGEGERSVDDDRQESQNHDFSNPNSSSQDLAIKHSDHVGLDHRKDESHNMSEVQSPSKSLSDNLGPDRISLLGFDPPLSPNDLEMEAGTEVVRTEDDSYSHTEDPEEGDTANTQPSEGNDLGLVEGQHAEQKISQKNETVAELGSPLEGDGPDFVDSDCMSSASGRPNTYLVPVDNRTKIFSSSQSAVSGKEVSAEQSEEKQLQDDEEDQILENEPVPQSRQFSETGEQLADDHTQSERPDHDFNHSAEDLFNGVNSDRTSDILSSNKSRFPTPLQSSDTAVNTDSFSQSLSDLSSAEVFYPPQTRVKGEETISEELGEVHGEGDEGMRKESPDGDQGMEGDQITKDLYTPQDIQLSEGDNHTISEHSDCISDLGSKRTHSQMPDPSVSAFSGPNLLQTLDRVMSEVNDAQSHFNEESSDQLPNKIQSTQSSAFLEQTKILAEDQFGGAGSDHTSDILSSNVMSRFTSPFQSLSTPVNLGSRATSESDQPIMKNWQRHERVDSDAKDHFEASHGLRLDSPLNPQTPKLGLDHSEVQGEGMVGAGAGSNDSQDQGRGRVQLSQLGSMLIFSGLSEEFLKTLITRGNRVHANEE